MTEESVLTTWAVCSAVGLLPAAAAGYTAWRGSRRWVKLAVAASPVSIFPVAYVSTALVWPGHFYTFPLGFLLLSVPLIALVFTVSVVALAA